MADASQTGKQRLALVDLSGIFWANWHATADQAVSEAFERTVSLVGAMAKGSMGAQLFAVCCDMPPYHRSKLLPTYKAQRAEAPPQAREQFERVKARLRADGLLLWGAPGFEADDVIAWAVAQAMADESIEAVTIVSNDKDLHQLVSDKVTCYSPMQRAYVGRDAVIDKHGVPPEMMLDYLALLGDSSDNVPGVPGVGAKTAATLMTTFGSLAAVIEDAKLPDGESKLTKPKLKAALVEHAEAARLARKVIALRTDVPLDWSELRMERKAEPLTERNPGNLDGDESIEATVVAAPPSANGSPNGKPTADRPLVADVQPQVRPAPLAIRAPEEWSLALEPRSQKGAWELAVTLHDSRLYQRLGGPEAIYAILLRGRSLGLDATTSLSAFHNISGSIRMHADLIEALVLRSGKAEYFEPVESDRKHATYCTKRVGGRREQVLTFTIEDALDAQLVVKDPNGRDGYNGRDKEGKPSPESAWSKYRETMLCHRAKTQLARKVYPEIVLGLYTPEELGGEVIDVR